MPDADKQRAADLALVEEIRATHWRDEYEGGVCNECCDEHGNNYPWPCDAIRLADRLEALARAGIEAREDAARYALLRDHAFRGSWDGTLGRPAVWYARGWPANNLTGHTFEEAVDHMRAAIDAARAPRNPKGGE